MKTFLSTGGIGLSVRFIIASGENAPDPAHFEANVNGAILSMRKDLNCVAHAGFHAGARLCTQLAAASFCCD